MRFRRKSACFALACIAAFTTACPDDEETNPDATAQSDAGVPDRGVNADADNADADNGDAEPLSDAAEADGGDAGFADAEQADAIPMGPVVVRMVSMNAPTNNIIVVFHDPSGAVINSTVTDSNGEASFDVPSGGMVTSFVPSLFGGPGGEGPPPPPGLHTIAGVEPGDTYVWPIDQVSIDVDVIVGSMQVTVPGTFAGADYYTVEFGCGPQTILDPLMAQPFEITERCVGTSTVVDLLAQARDATYEVIAWSVVRDVPISNNVAVAFPTWDTTFVDVLFSITSAPPLAVAGDVTLELIRRGVPYQETERAESFAAGTLDLQYTMPDFGDGRDINAELNFGSASSLFAGRYDRANPLDFDFLADAIPYLTGAELDRAADPARPSITWTVGQGTPQTFVMVGFNSALISWTVVAPPSTTIVKQPELPAELAHFRPDANTMFQSPVVILVSSDLYPDYASYRRTLGPVGFFGVFTATQIPINAPVGTEIRGAAYGGD